MRDSRVETFRRAASELVLPQPRQLRQRLDDPQRVGPAERPVHRERPGDLLEVGNELDRSRWFDTDQVGVRAKMRVDGALMDDHAIVSLVQNV